MTGRSASPSPHCKSTPCEKGFIAIIVTDRQRRTAGRIGRLTAIGHLIMERLRTAWHWIRAERRPRRILWILNHKVLLAAEVPLLESLGFEVVVPTSVPGGTEYISATGRHAGRSTLDPAQLALLQDHAFYSDNWSDQLSHIINREFDLVVSSIYQTPLTESISKFRGPVMARVFGMEGTKTYSEIFDYYRCREGITQSDGRFILGQAYPYIEEIEDAWLARTAQTVGCSIPAATWQQRDTWGRTHDELLFLCPSITSKDYYRAQYETIKNCFASLNHLIVGAQADSLGDPAVLGYVTDSALFDLYRTRAAFVYISPEERHLHYSPLEAIIVGMPVLYLQGSMLARLAEAPLPGECKSLEEMRTKAEELLRGNSDLQNAITSTQGRILFSFGDDVVTRQWRTALASCGL